MSNSRLTQLKSILIAAVMLSSFSAMAEEKMPATTQEFYDNEARTVRQAGYKLQMAGDLEGARQAYEKAIGMDPSYAEVHNDLGVVFESMNEMEKAIVMYKKAIAIDKNYLPAYTNLAFIYEKTGELDNAGIYWKKRYDMGQDGEYWKEVARQHLLKLGTFPDVKEDRLQEDAVVLSKNIVFQREQARMKIIEEAKMHFDLGRNFMTKGDFTSAVREFETARFLKPDDAPLLLQIEDFYANANKVLAKEKATIAAQAAVDSIKNEDYATADSKLRESSELVAPLSK